MTNYSDDKFSILLIADNFDPHFAPLCDNVSWGNWSLASIKFLDLALNWISLINSPDTPNILIVSSTLSEEDLDAAKRKWAFYFKSFRALRFENYKSVGQIMREVGRRNLLPKGEFLLIENLATFCSSNLSSQIQTFRNRRKKDKYCVMSLFYSHQISDEQRFVGYETNSKKLLLYQGKKDRHINEYTKNMFVTQSTIRGDLAPCGIALCSAEILIQFIDNYDFNSFDQAIHDILVNEELHFQTINVEILPESVMAFTASDFGSLLRAQKLLVHRWCYPQTFDRLPSRVFENRSSFRYYRNHVYVPRDEEPPIKAEGIVLGRGIKIASGVTLINVTIGNGGILKEKVTFRNVIAGKNLQVGEGTVIDEAVIGDNVIIGSNCKIGIKTVIGSGVNIPNDIVIGSNLVVMATPFPELNDNITSHPEGYFTWKLLNQSSSCPPIQDDDTIVPDIILNPEHYRNEFMKEICESMIKTFKSENRANQDSIENLGTEIICSKLANNISVEDFTYGVFTAFLTLPLFESTKQLDLIIQTFIEWKPLWKNYYQTDQDKLQLCYAIEDQALENPVVRSLVGHIFMCVYKNLDDMEDAIILWYDSLPQDSVLRDDLSKFIEWLTKDEDEGEDDEDEEDA